jgi:uncharacterized membrane protein YhaH (DUF805 family)
MSQKIEREQQSMTVYDLLASYASTLEKCFDFKGWSSRKEFWIVMVGSLLVSCFLRMAGSTMIRNPAYFEAIDSTQNSFTFEGSAIARHWP